MKKTLVTLSCLTLALAFSMTADAKTKKNEPKKKDVLNEIKEIGEAHYVEKMKVYDIGSVESGETYYHIFNGQLKNGGYHVIIYDNEPKYLGFYYSELEPTGYEEGAVELVDEDGETYYYLAIPEKGPGAKARIGSMPATFVKNPKLEEEAKVADSGEAKLVVPEKQKSESGEVIDYRDWKITMQGKAITVNALFEKVEKGKVHIKSSKNGKTAVIPASALSAEDKEYIKRITAK